MFIEHKISATLPSPTKTY